MEIIYCCIFYSQPPLGHSRQAKDVIFYLSTRKELQPPRPGWNRDTSRFPGQALLKKEGKPKQVAAAKNHQAFQIVTAPKFLLPDRRSTRGTKGEVVDYLLTAGEPHRHT